MIQVPPQFQPRQKKEYPQGNRHPFEEWFFDNYEGGASREYLPIFWTSYYCQNGYGKEPNSIKELQKFLDRLPQKKWFAIVQYDDGILNDLSKLDIKVFAMSGERIDYPLPLICWPSDRIRQRNRRFKVSFVGRPTHWIREELLENRRLIRDGWIITANKFRKHEYMDIMCESVFTLCPRGYGRTSFRIQEAIECGSIPVYIGDRFIIPHGVNFDTYGVTVTPDRINNLPEIIAEISDEEIKQKQGMLKEVFEKYYSYEGVKKLMLENL